MKILRALPPFQLHRFPSDFGSPSLIKDPYDLSILTITAFSRLSNRPSGAFASRPATTRPRARLLLAGSWPWQPKVILFPNKLHQIIQQLIVTKSGLQGYNTVNKSVIRFLFKRREERPHETLVELRWERRRERDESGNETAEINAARQ
jgi:hypothetical protein